jgi:hypothetical protein
MSRRSEHENSKTLRRRINRDAFAGRLWFKQQQQLDRELAAREH